MKVGIGATVVIFTAKEGVWSTDNRHGFNAADKVRTKVLVDANNYVEKVCFLFLFYVIKIISHKHFFARQSRNTPLVLSPGFSARRVDILLCSMIKRTRY